VVTACLQPSRLVPAAGSGCHGATISCEGFSSHEGRQKRIPKGGSSLHLARASTLDGSVVLCDNYRVMPVLLRHWREKRGYSMRELARRAKVGFVTVSRIENGHISPTVAMLEKLARALGITVRDFFPSGRTAVRKRRSKREHK